jgi:hypothetical protein
MSNLSGRKPISQKAKRTSALDEPDFFTNRLAISSEVKEELKLKKLDSRWISFSRYVANGNMHERGWVVYKRDSKPAGDAIGFGANPDGIIRIGDNVLAVRPIEYSKKHKQWLAAKANRLSGFQEQKTEELRQKAQEAGAAIVEGFEENE